jgi:hypothetical protein
MIKKVIMIRIKPHHFLDIIKLYGKGIEKFVPDTKYNHNFYGVANDLIANHERELTITSGSDDICSPCIYLGKDKKCTDRLNKIGGIKFKNEWNEIIDKRIIEYTKMIEGKRYSAKELCEILFKHKEHIYAVWNEESKSDKDSRYEAFCSGAKKYLGISL